MNKKIDVTEYEYSSCKVSEEFNGFRIAAISDLHCNEIGTGNEPIISKLISLKPDIIICAGDMITSNGKETEKVIDLMEKLTTICPVYHSMGNHELKLRINPKGYRIFLRYKKALRSVGVHFLINRSHVVKKNDQAVKIYGLNIKHGYYHKFWKKVFLPDNYIKSLLGPCDHDKLNIMIAHNPEYHKDYAKWGADIVISGHIHGGMVVLPVIGGVISPTLQIFPHYDFGEYTQDSSKMYLTRGLGWHSLPVRWFNPPEIMMITLRRKDFGDSC